MTPTLTMFSIDPLLDLDIIVDLIVFSPWYDSYTNFVFHRPTPRFGRYCGPDSFSPWYDSYTNYDFQRPTPRFGRFYMDLVVFSPWNDFYPNYDFHRPTPRFGRYCILFIRRYNYAR